MRRSASLASDVRSALRRVGRVRALVYRTVGQTGLLRGEITRLRIEDVDLKSGRIRIPAWIAKSRREQHVLLNSDLVRRLGAYVRTLAGNPSSPLFPAAGSHPGRRAPSTAVPTVETFRKDLEAAGIPVVDERGRIVDFHALRMTYITHLRAAGVPLDMAQRLARHSDRALTEQVYTDDVLLHEQDRQAAEMLAPERRRRR